VLEAFEHYWRKTPHVKRLVFKVVPDESTRLAMRKRGEADVAITFLGALAEELKRSPGLTIKPTYMPWTQWVSFNAEPWDPKSPWRDQRVRLAANLAMDRPAINQALFLGLSKVTASIIPQLFDFSWAAPPYPHDPAKAKQLLAEAGYPSGFDGGALSSDLVYASFAEAAANYLAAVGIRLKLTPMERAAHTKALQEKKIRGLSVVGTASFGNAATRIEATWPAPEASRGAAIRPRRTLPGAGERDRQEAARGDPGQAPAGHARPRVVRSAPRARAPERPRASRVRIRPRPHRRPRVLRALRGRQAQDPVEVIRALGIAVALLLAATTAEPRSPARSMTSSGCSCAG
jgi:hypothetical protein